jgi:hypothetical protein
VLLERLFALEERLSVGEKTEALSSALETRPLLGEAKLFVDETLASRASLGRDGLHPRAVLAALLWRPGRAGGGGPLLDKIAGSFLIFRR